MRENDVQGVNNEIRQFSLVKIHARLQQYFYDLKASDNIAIPDIIQKHQNLKWHTSSNADTEQKGNVDNFFNDIISLHQSNDEEEKKESDNPWTEGFGEKTEFRKYLKTEISKDSNSEQDLQQFINSLIIYISLVNSLSQEEQSKYLQTFPGRDREQKELVCLEGASQRMQAALKNIHCRSLDADLKTILYTYERIVEKYRIKFYNIFPTGEQPHIAPAIYYLHGFDEQGEHHTIPNSYRIPAQKAWEMEVNKERNLNTELKQKRTEDIEYVKGQLVESYSSEHAQNVNENLREYGFGTNDVILYDDNEDIDYENPEWDFDKIETFFPTIEITLEGPELPQDLFDVDTPKKLAEILKGDNQTAKSRALIALNLMSRTRGGSIMQLQQTMLELNPNDSENKDVTTGFAILASIFHDETNSKFINKHIDSIKNTVEANESLLTNQSLNELFLNGCNTQQLIKSIKECTSSDELNNITSESLAAYSFSSGFHLALKELSQHSLFNQDDQNFNNLAYQLIIYLTSNNNIEALKSIIQEFGNPPIYKRETLLKRIANENLLEQLIKDKNPTAFTIAEICIAHMSMEKKNIFLLHASTNGNDKIVELLLQHKADVNVADETKWTPLHWAAYQGYTETIQLLLKHNAEVNAENKKKNTPLHLAVQQGHTEIIQLLLKHNAEVNAYGYENFIPLHLAAHLGYTEIVQLLLNYKSEVNAVDKEKWTPLHWATNKGHKDIVESLLQNKANINARDVNKWTPLHAAAQHGHIDVVELLLQNKAEVNALTDNKWTPLHATAQHGYTDVVELLLQNKAEVNALTDNKWTPLHLAAEQGNTDAIKLLLQNKAEVNALTDNKWTPLHLAAKHGHTDAIKLLLQNKAEVNALTDNEWTPLHLAAKHGHTDAIELLLQNKAEVNALTDNKWTPLHLAAEQGNTDAIKLLLQSKAEVNARNVNKWTPLHVAAEQGHTDAIELLLQNKAEVNALTDNKWTPLHAAVQHGHTDVVELLLQNKAEVNAASDYGLTPLHLVSLKKEGTEIIQHLVKKGAKIDKENKDGITPLDYLLIDEDYYKITTLLAGYQGNIDFIKSIRDQRRRSFFYSNESQQIEDVIGDDLLYVLDKIFNNLKDCIPEEYANKKLFITNVLGILLESPDDQLPSPIQEIVHAIQKPNILLKGFNYLIGRDNITNIVQIENELIPNAVKAAIENAELQKEYPDEYALLYEKIHGEPKQENAVNLDRKAEDRASSRVAAEEPQFKSDDDEITQTENPERWTTPERQKSNSTLIRD